MAQELFNPDKSDIEVIATAKKGVISEIAMHYRVSRQTIYQYFHRTPDGKEILARVRALNTEDHLDLAEHVMMYNLANYKTNPGLAQRSAEKIIDSKGYARGWKEPVADSTAPQQANIDKDDIIARLVNEIAELKAINANK